MKKGRARKVAAQVPIFSEKDHVHFRLCHICLHLNESSSEILRCQQCKKYLSVESIWEFIEKNLDEEKEEQAVAALDQGEQDILGPNFGKRAPLLTGLSVLW